MGRATNTVTPTVMHAALKRDHGESDNGGCFCSHCYLLLYPSRTYVVLFDDLAFFSSFFPYAIKNSRIQKFIMNTDVYTNPL